jgi:phospholipid/cholesterol/gamma-HCH transport system substrate-binding protein
VEKKIYIKIGIITSLIIFALIWGVNYLKGKDIFSSEYIYYVVYDRIDGLQVSNPVLVNGYTVGQVRNIGFLPDNSGKIVVTMALTQNFNIPGNTIARIFSSDLMGTKAVELIFGKTDYFQQPGDTLKPDFEGSLQEMVSVQMLPLKNKAEDLMKQMEDAIEIINYIFNEKTQANIMASFEDIKITFENLKNSSSNLDTIVYSNKNRLDAIMSNIESISANIEKNNDNVSRVLDNTSRISDSLANSNITQTINQLSELIAELNITMQKINNSEGSLGLLVNNDTLYYNLEDVTYNLNKLLIDMRVNPKRYVHFSMFNTGKTVYVEDANQIKGKKQKIRYKVMIYHSNTPVSLNSPEFKEYKNIEEAVVNNEYIYMTGNEKNKDKAKILLKKVSVDFPDAKIVEIKGGEYTIVN